MNRSMTPFIWAHDGEVLPWQSHWSASCDHDCRPRIKTMKCGRRARLQCIRCGQGFGQFLKLSEAIEPWDEEREERVLREASELCEAQREKWEIQKFNRETSWWIAYRKYLLSDVWQTKRRLVLERSGGKCEACGQEDATQVHHLAYPLVFGMEPLWDLRAVCRPCHEALHGV